MLQKYYYYIKQGSWFCICIVYIPVDSSSQIVAWPFITCTCVTKRIICNCWFSLGWTEPSQQEASWPSYPTEEWYLRTASETFQTLTISCVYIALIEIASLVLHFHTGVSFHYTLCTSPVAFLWLRAHALLNGVLKLEKCNLVDGPNGISTWRVKEKCAPWPYEYCGLKTTSSH